MRALVLGGNRYIGLHLVHELARRGHEVTVINSHDAPLPEGVVRLHADRREPGALWSMLVKRRDQFDIVFDNTAYTVTDLQPVVEAFRDRASQIVFTSSTAVYRRSYVQPIRETFRTHDARDPDPRKAYGVGKVQCERFLQQEWERHHTPTTCLRVGHTLGPMSPLASRDPVFFARLEQGRPILVPGEGFAAVHLVHVNDVARLMASLVGNPLVAGQIYNVAGREITSILGAVQIMARAVGVEPNIVHVPMELARGRTPPLVHWGEALTGGMMFSIDKALRDLDWSPEYGLEDGYRQSYAWFKAGGRDRYEFDFGADDELLAALT
jgi:nucleoside-diphosphate-sugar epimerase